MMHHTAALILKKTEWGEADWLVSALTERFGKIRLFAQGARKHGAKLRGHLEPGSISELSFVVGRNGYRLTGARLREVPVPGASISQARAVAAIAALLDESLLEERDGATELFRTAASVLARLGQAPEAASAQLVAWFHVRLWDALGLLPAAGSPEAERIPALLALGRQPLEAVGERTAGLTALWPEISRLGGGPARRYGNAFLPFSPAAYNGNCHGAPRGNAG